MQCVFYTYNTFSIWHHWQALENMMGKLDQTVKVAMNQVADGQVSFMDRLKAQMQAELNSFTQLQSSKLSTLDAKLENVQLRLKAQPTALSLVVGAPAGAETVTAEVVAANGTTFPCF